MVDGGCVVVIPKEGGYQIHVLSVSGGRVGVGGLVEDKVLESFQGVCRAPCIA